MVRKILRDDQWVRIGHMLPGKKSDRGQTAAGNRLFVEAILWIARTGSPWRDLPEEFGFWNSVYKRFSRWSDAGVWQNVFGEFDTVVQPGMTLGNGVSATISIKVA